MGSIEGFWEIEDSYGNIWNLQYPQGGLQKLTGTGIPVAQYATQKAPGQHGSSHLGYVLEDRTVQIGLAWRGRGSVDCLYDTRVNYPYSYLHYLHNPLILRRALISGVVRELHNVWYVGGLERDSDKVLGRNTVETAAIQLHVRDPIWFDPTLYSYAVTTAAMATGDELVFDTPGGVVGPTAIFGTADYLTFGSSTINLTLNSGEITTAGDWYTFPTITVVGPASDIEIENQTAGYQITMDYDIPAGRTVTFDLRYGYKTVTDDLGVNLVGFVPATDDLADFCLWPAPLATDGENDFRLFAGNATGATSITIEWYDRYLAI